MSVLLRHLPESLSRKRIKCGRCNKEFKPDWFTKVEIPFIPVKPGFERPGVEYTGPGRWITKKASQICPRCEAEVMIDLPIKKLRTKVLLFGDDAKRTRGNRSVSIYSLVGADQAFLPEFEANIRDAKRRLLPSIPQDSWKIHMKEMWSGSSRKRSPVFCNLSFNNILTFIHDLLEAVKSSKIFIYNIAAVSNQRKSLTNKEEKNLRDDAYLLLVSFVINELTERSAQPNIFFDSEKRSSANNTIHGWARDAFKGSQHSLLYGFFSKGIEIPEPQFVPPASTPGLEIADFVSFVIARYYLRMWQDKDVEVDPKNFGPATFLKFSSPGNLFFLRQEGYPWDHFYGL